ncbi:MAG: PAS domain S-box-containing protein [Flavobacteriaceae bacterium]|jgi:PAS domain S-box-containing protein
MLTYISPSGIFLTDIQGKIIFVNPSWCEIAEIPQRGALNNKWFEAIHPDDKDAVRQK